MKPSILIFIPTVAASILTGCAPAGLCAGVSYAADKYQSRDAAALRVEHHPHLSFNTRLCSDLEDVIGIADLTEMKRQGAHVLTAAQALAVKTASGEIDRMSPEGIAFLTEQYGHGAGSANPGKARPDLKERFSDESQAALADDLALLRSATDVRVARRMLSRIDQGIEASAGDRGKIARVLMTAPLFIPATIGAGIADTQATQRIIDSSFEQVFVYRPSDTDDARTAEQLASATDEQLAHWYAPVFIQQTDPDAPYPSSEDRFGRVGLSGAPDRIEVAIDIDRPTVYWRIQEAKLSTEEHAAPIFGHSATGRFSPAVGPERRTQIVYVAWYPSRPAFTSGDSEAGLIDGVVIRLTLDRRNRPAVYEFVRSCGCYHMLYVAEFVEAAARRYFGGPLPGKKFTIQKAGPNRELFLPSLVRDDGSHPARPVAYVSSGYHMLMGVETGGVWREGSEVKSERTYVLETYDTLTHLPLGNGVASMFGSDGLVHNAGRPAGLLLAPTGMQSAGQPRQLGTMKIRMDAYDYDDPYLLDRQLRFPASF